MNCSKSRQVSVGESSCDSAISIGPVFEDCDEELIPLNKDKKSIKYCGLSSSNYDYSEPDVDAVTKQPRKSRAISAINDNELRTRQVSFIIIMFKLILSFILL